MRWMKTGMVVGAAATALLFGCSNSQQARSSASSGSLALSTDDSLLYAADTDNGVVSVIETKSDSKLFEVQVGVRPYRVVVGPDDTVYVANRGSRSVSVIRKGEQQVSAEIATGVDPTGMAMSHDGKTLYIVNATATDTTDYGTLQAIDTATLQPKYEKAIGYEPRSIAVISDKRALVTQYRGGEQGADLVEVNLETGDVTNGGNTGLYDKVNATRSTGGSTLFPTSGTFSTFKARAMTDVVATPEGDRAFVPTVWAREDAIGRRPSSSGGYYSAGGPCNIGAVATAGIVTVDTAGSGAADPQVDDLTACSAGGTNSGTKDFPPTALGQTTVSFGSTTPKEAVQGPSAVAVDPTGEWLYMVNKETSNLAIVPAWRRAGRDGEDINFDADGSSLRDVVGISENAGLNTGSDGIALTRDGMRAYVYSQFNHKVTRFGANGRGPTAKVERQAEIDLGLKDTLPAELAIGRRFFFDASSTTMSSELTHVACSTCHLEGRDDAHVWSFPDGPRQTPALVGRGLRNTAPFHWSGEFSSFDAFMNHTVELRMGGKGVTPELNAKIASWLESEPAPENANARPQLTAAQAHGEQVFMAAGCGSCHTGADFTNSTAQDVGTFKAPANGQPGDVLPGGSHAFDTPSLRGLARSAPYLHDGSNATLLDRVKEVSTQHGNLGPNVSDQDRADLVEYLKTL